MDVSNDNKDGTERLARALGWASLGLGVAQISAPRALSRQCGVDDSTRARTALPLVGVRELAHAAGLLFSHRPAPWIWTRVAGDAVDLTLLGAAMKGREGERRRRTVATTAVVAGITAVDLYTAIRTTGKAQRGNEALRVRASITVNRPPDEVYGFWRDLENLPQFMAHLDSVRMTGDGRSCWVAKAPAGRTVEWDAEVVEDLAGELIAWRSVGGNVRNSGTVGFTAAPGGRGTEVRVELEYTPPGGKVGAAVAKLFGEHPDQQVRDDLRRFKQVIETGEVVRSEGSPSGTSTRQMLKQHPAQAVERPRTATDRLPAATGTATARG